MGLLDLKKKEKRTEMLTARVTATTKQRLEAISKVLGRSNADVLEELIAQGFKEVKGPKPVKGGKNG